MDNSFKNNNGLGVFNTTTFSVILRRYSLLELPWRRIHNVIAKAMSMFFRYPSPDTNVSTYPSGGEVSQGRSMIEMLGVLAIIAVLSVGGIAGYSKAMEKFKINKAVREYSYLIQGLLEHITEIQNLSSAGETNQNYDIVNIVFAKNLVPETWVKHNSISMRDAWGNVINIFSRNQHLVLDMYLGGFSALEDGGKASLAFSPKFCSTLLQDVAQPLSSVLYRVWFTYSSIPYYFGDKFCGVGKKCIRNLTLTEIQQSCKYCTKESGKPCGLILEF